MTTLITALDYFDENSALATVERIGDGCQWYKVGKQLFTSAGPGIVRQLKKMGKSVFLDLKYHDIPNTVSQAVAAAAGIGADMCNVHASGGPAMLAAAAESIPPEEEVDFTLDRPFVFLLTSSDNIPLYTGVVNQP